MKRKSGIKTIETNFQLIKIVKRQFGNEKKAIIRTFLEAWNKLTLNHRLGAVLSEIMGCQSDLYRWGQKGNAAGGKRSSCYKFKFQKTFCLLYIISVASQSS